MSARLTKSGRAGDSGERRRLRELLVHDSVTPETDGLALDDQDAAGLERPRSRLAVARPRPLSRGALGRVFQRPTKLGAEPQGGLEALARPTQGRGLLGHDLLFRPSEGFLAVTHEGSSTTPAAISSAIRSSL